MPRVALEVTARPDWLFAPATFFVDRLGRAGAGRPSIVELTLSEAQHSARLAVYMTDTIVVRLMEEPDGGYRWRLSSADPATIEMIDHRYEPARGDYGTRGASVWTFKPKKTGRTRLALTKLHPQHGGETPADQFAVDLDIR